MARLFLGNVAIDVPYPSGKIPYKFCFYRMKDRLPNCLFYYRNSGRQGEITLDGNRYRVLVMDENADGRFDDLKNGTPDHRPEPGRPLGGDPRFGRVLSTQRAVQRARQRLGSRLAHARRAANHLAALEGRRAHQALSRRRLSRPRRSAGRGLDGKPIDLKSEAAKGRYVLLDFWASWCGPCRGEFPTIRRTYARYKDHGLTIIGVNLDSDRAKAIDAAAQAKLAYSHVFDGQGWKNAVALLYRVHGIPQVYLLDSDLKIVGKNLRGPMLEKRLRELLGPGDEAAAKAIDEAMPPEKKPVPPVKKTPNKAAK